ncbi:uncharacterized protein PF3D7_1120000 [Anabrus simplex]|uniref:uncharacterized protein PF3D7_1120000 n=1 Tax=Anabrus simplex TaxID=316456 RepID=UPI0034DD0D81
MPYKMELEVHVKGEPVWLEETENWEHVSERTHLKEEFKLELTELEGTQENYEHVSEMPHVKEEFKSELMTELGRTEPSEDAKEEVITEEHAVGQPVQCFKEENM